MSRPIAPAPHMAAMIMGLKNEWAKNDNGRIVILLKEHENGSWIIRARPGEPDLHVRGTEGNKLSAGAIIQRRNLLVICAAASIHIMQASRR